ncbi:MFS transporter [bacterium]|nr:MFS transporter [bacterium]
MVRTVGVAGSLHFLIHFAMMTHPALVALAAVRGGDLFGIGEAGMWGYLLFGIFALVSGFLTDFWGSRFVLLLTGILVALGLWMVASLGSDGVHPESFRWAFALVGAGCGLYHPAGLALLGGIPLERRPSAMALHGVFGNAGIGSAPFIAYVGMEALGIVPFFVGIGTVSLGAGLVALTLPKCDVRAGRKRDHWKEFLTQTRPGYGIFFCWQGVVGIYYRMLITYLPAILGIGLSSLPKVAEGVGPLFSSVALGLGILFQLLSGKWAKPGHLARQTALLFCGLALLGLVSGWVQGVGSLVWVALMGGVVFGHQPLTNSLLPRFVGEGHRGLGYGIQFFISFGMGSVGAWWGARLLGKEFQGFQDWLWVLVGLATLSAVLMVLLSEKERSLPVKKPIR